MDLFEKQLSSEYFYRGKIINMRVDSVLLPDGNEALREMVEHPGGVCVAPLTEDGQVIFVRQFRYPYGEEVLEIPAGKREDPAEDPLECGKRELLEETGATAERFLYLGKIYPTPGYTNELLHLYAATGLSFGEACPDEDEFLFLEKLPLAAGSRLPWAAFSSQASASTFCPIAL